MTFAEASDRFISDMQMDGRINSAPTVKSYRSTLRAHGEDVDNRDPRLVGPDDVKATLARWPNPNTRRVQRSILMSFYRWCMEEQIRATNPVEQTRRPKQRPTSVYRMTRAEVVAFLAAAEGEVEHRATRLGVCAGLRNAELRGLQGRHFRRPGFVWVSQDIAKGGKERWVPVVGDLKEVWYDVHRNVADEEYVLPAQRWRDPGANTVRTSLKLRPMSPQGLYYLVGRVAERAGIHAHIHPHLMRHAFGDHIAKLAGLLAAQAMLGHSSVATTRDTYVGGVTLDELTAAVQGVSFTINLLSPLGTPSEPLEAPTRIELV